MNRRDQGVIGALLFMLAVIVVAVAMPAQPSPAATPSPTTAPIGPRAYREGILGQARFVSPLTARTQADRDLVALVFSGLVRLGPGETVVPDLASAWKVDETGRVWTFTIREDARWHDGTPVTSEDVVFTVRTLQDEAYTGPGAGSWRAIAVSAPGRRTVRFELESALGGFLHAATQRIAPAHLLRAVPVTSLATDTFNRRPIGSGPFALVELDDRRARLEPAALVGPLRPAPVATASPIPTDTIGTPGPTRPPTRPLPYLPAIELRFFADAERLAEAYRAGEIDAVSGLPSPAAVSLAAATGTRVVSYPGSTLTAVLLNLRSHQAAFREPAVRLALLAGIDRDAVIDRAFGGAAERADTPIPPASWAFDREASVPVEHDAAAAIDGLGKAGWTRVDGAWALPDATEPFVVELLSPEEASNAGASAAAAAVAEAWRRIGLRVTHEALPPAELVMDRLRTGLFVAAVVDINIGMDPDLYPLLASTQVTSSGTNFAGVQDPDLDKLLLAARAPGTNDERRTAYAALQARLAERQYVLPLAFHEVLVVARNDLSGPSPRRLADPSGRFWDVLTWRLAADR